MKLEQSFEVTAPLQRVWEALIDVQRVAPCLPGASVTGRNDDGSYNGEFKVKIGPTSAAYTGKLNMENVDESAHTATMQAAGTDKRGQGGAKATIISTVAPAGEGAAKVDVSTDYHITGRLARFGRGGMIEEISGKLLTEFASNLQSMLASDGAGAAGAEPAAAASAQTSAAVPSSADADAPASEGVQVPASEAAQVPPGDPDGAIEGALPTPESLAGETGTPGPPPSAPGGAASFTPPPAAESEPISAVSLMGGVVARRAKENPAPLAALLVGFLVALRVLRRRS